MKLDDFLREEMLDFAARELPEPREDALALDVAHEERRRLLQRVTTATVALVIAFLLAWHFAPGAAHRGDVRIEHHGPTTTVPAPRRPSTPPREHNDNTGDPSGPAVVVATRSQGPTTGTPSHDGGGNGYPPVTFPVTKKPVLPPVQPDSGDMWAIASETQGDKSPLVVVFGLAPAGHHVTVSSTLGTHTYAINSQGDFRWTYPLKGKLPAFPLTFHVQCDGCGSADLSIASYDPAPSQPTPTAGFSAFAAPDPAPGTFVFGGFEPVSKVNSVQLTSSYGNAQFAVRHGTYGGRVTFANAPLNTQFAVDLTAGGTTVHLTVVRSH